MALIRFNIKDKTNLKFILFLLFTFVKIVCVNAQIVLDGTMGPAEALEGPGYSITHDLGTTVGTYLFHSFSDFNLNNGESATFSGPDSIANVFSRVTGGNPSNIDGLLKSTIQDANLYFLNPAGVMFGPEAQLDVKGSFTVSTADYLKLGDNGRFDATQPDNTVLTSAPVEAFGFLNRSPGTFSISGSKLISRVPDGRAFSVFSGNINISNANINIRKGQINLVSVESEGEVKIENSDSRTTEIDVSSFTDFGEIMVTDTSELDVGDDGGGQIVVYGEKLEIISSVIRSNTSGQENTGNIFLGLGDLKIKRGGQITTIASGSGSGGTLRVNAENIRINGLRTSRNTGLFTQKLDGIGNGGDIIIQSQTIDLMGGGKIAAGALGLGDSGNIEINAGSIDFNGTGTQLITGIVTFSKDGAGGDITIHSDSIILNGGDRAHTLILAQSFAPKEEGDVIIRSKVLELHHGAKILTNSLRTGTGGDINLEIDEHIVIDGQTQLGSVSGIGTTPIPIGTNNEIIIDAAGQPVVIQILAETTTGDIQIKTEILKITNGGRINTNTVSNVEGGNITLQNITHLTLMDGVITSSTFAEGNGGSIEIDAKSIHIGGVDVENNSEISANTESTSTGKGGMIRISSDRLTMDSGSILATSSSGTGDAGDIELTATDTLTIKNGNVTTNASMANGGDIAIHSGTSITMNESQITGEAENNGGNIRLTAPETIRLRHSDIIAEAGNNGGNITIDPIHTILENSSLIADAIMGNGGNISIETDVFILTPDSVIRADSQEGDPGNIEITAPDSAIAGSLVTLPGLSTISDVQFLPGCASREPGDFSSFIVLGREVRPFAPGDVMPSYSE